MRLHVVAEAENGGRRKGMSVQLLDNTRKLNQLLHNNPNSGKVLFNDICKILSEVLASHVLVISRKGKLLGLHNLPGSVPLGQFLPAQVGAHIDALLNERFLNILSTKENMNLLTLGFEDCGENYQAMAAPIEIAGERLGTLFLYRLGAPYTIDDIILSEYGTTVVGLEIMRSDAEQSAEEIRQQQTVRSAIGSLSVTELDAVRHVFRELSGTEGILVTSKVADRAGITRSVIVNALRKLESAGIIESRSSGMKGTYLRVLNSFLLSALEASGCGTGM